MSACGAQPGDVFNQIDANNDGVISRAEFNAAMGGAVVGGAGYGAPQTVYASAPVTTIAGPPVTYTGESATGMTYMAEPVATTAQTAMSGQVTYAAPPTTFEAGAVTYAAAPMEFAQAGAMTYAVPPTAYEAGAMTYAAPPTAYEAQVFQQAGAMTYGAPPTTYEAQVPMTVTSTMQPGAEAIMMTGGAMQTSTMGPAMQIAQGSSVMGSVEVAGAMQPMATMGSVEMGMPQPVATNMRPPVPMQTQNAMRGGVTQVRHQGTTDRKSVV